MVHGAWMHGAWYVQLPRIRSHLMRYDLDLVSQHGRPSSAVWWLSHEHAKQRFALDTQQSEEAVTVLIASGTLAAVTSTVVSMPLDVIKTRMQCASTPLSTHDVLRGIMRDAGWRGLWAGFIPRMVAAAPRSIFTVLFYERAIALCRA